MTPRSIELQNFRSFRKRTVLDLSALHGLVHVTGDNRESERLGANGVGKSSLFDALYWCLYGRTSRGLKGQVRSWGADKGVQVTTLVSVELEDGKVVTRSIKPNALTIDGVPADQAQVDALVGLNADEFLHSAYQSQFEPKFTDLRPAEQLALYSQVMDLERWEQASERASKATREMEVEIAKTAQALASAQGKAEALHLQEEQARDLERVWSKQHKQQVDAAEEALRRAAAEVQQRKRRVKPLDNAAATKARASEKSAYAQMEVAKRAMHAAETALGKANKLGAECPACGQAVSSAHRKRLAEEAKAVFAKAETDFDRWAREADAAQRQLRAAEQSAKEAVEAERELGRAVEEHNRQAAEIKRLREQKNPHAQSLAQAKRGLEEAQELVRKLSDVLAEESETVERVRYWVKGFRDLRLWVVDESLAQLEVEVNSALHEVGLEGWAMQFDVERETKSGGVSRGFSIMVQSPDNEEPVPWESWSGGESQRLRLACAMGVANLIYARRGVRPGLELWDEPSTWLSEEGIEDMLTLLEQRASDRTVLIADHRALDFGRFAATVTVVRDAQGSRIAGAAAKGAKERKPGWGA